MTIIEKGSDLLTKTAVEALTPKELKEYTENAAKFVAAFNEQFPDGKPVKANIKQIVQGKRANLIVQKHQDLSTESFGFPYSVTDRMAENVTGGDTTSLVAMVHTSLQPLQLTMTVKAVNAGDTYETKDGEVREYKVPAIVKVAGTREEVVLSADAKRILSGIHSEVLKDSIMNASKARREAAAPTPATTSTPAPDEAEDDAEV